MAITWSTSLILWIKRLGHRTAKTMTHPRPQRLVRHKGSLNAAFLLIAFSTAMEEGRKERRKQRKTRVVMVGTKEEKVKVRGGAKRERQSSALPAHLQGASTGRVPPDSTFQLEGRGCPSKQQWCHQAQAQPIQFLIKRKKMGHYWREPSFTSSITPTF